ncbi:MAG TPA: CheR family methyltransferase [Gemmatimonadales bacterium]|nr:CheR family methyltransferase [Gemmatimonadales bacterium]
MSRGGRRCWRTSIRAAASLFHGYKPTGLMRRIRKRMQVVGIESFSAYEDFLEVHPDEFGGLFNTILINVTSFFRDPEAWETLRTEVLPELLARKHEDDHIRIWSAGCASGEEAYTVAILLAELLGLDQFRERVKIYATDIDEEALAVARQAVYGARQLQDVPPELVSKYFEQTENSFSFRKDLRRQVIFGRHDVMQDPPISRVDLLLCRNTLMYFSAETQARILSRFHFALNENGYLFLGRAETLMTQTRAFAPVDLKRRISRKVNLPYTRERIMIPAFTPVDDGRRDTLDARVNRAALHALPLAQITVDLGGVVVAVSDRARALFGLSSADLQRPLHELKLSYRPVELRSLIEQASVERRPTIVRDVEWQDGSSDVRWFDVQVIALADPDGTLLGSSVTFTDVTSFKRLQRELEHSHQELETAYEELQSTNEELETTNEELQSTIEELETTNEELQSTNEELETMNEELQSTNEELHTINDELRERSDQLNGTNAFLESVLGSLSGGVAVVDREMRILGWNGHSEEMWGLRGDEVRGEHLLNLDIGLPLDQLRAPIRACLTDEESRATVTVDAINRRGRPFKCHVTCSPLSGGDHEVRGVILLMEEAE